MKLNDTDIEYFIDYINKKIHVLDLYENKQNSLTNAIDPTFQQKLIDQEKLLQDVIDFDWICYASDGIIAVYNNYNFNIISPKLPYLYEPYLKVLLKRRKPYGKS